MRLVMASLFLLFSVSPANGWVEVGHSVAICNCGDAAVPMSVCHASSVSTTVETTVKTRFKGVKASTTAGETQTTGYSGCVSTVVEAGTCQYWTYIFDCHTVSVLWGLFSWAECELVTVSLESRDTTWMDCNQ